MSHHRANGTVPHVPIPPQRPIEIPPPPTK